MNRELIVTLLRKQIQELDMMTEGFMEMHEYPASIMLLAKLKANDIQDYIQKLAELKPEKNQVLLPESKVIETAKPIAIIATEEVLVLENKIEENKIEADVLEYQANEEIGIESINHEELNIIVEEPIEVKSLAEVPEEIIPPQIAEKPVEIEQPKLAPTQELVVENVVEIEPSTPELPKITAQEHVETTLTSRNDLLAKGDNSLSAAIANKKVDDIKQAISIGDRFRFQRELFKGNGEDMNKTMTYLNQLASLDEALNFLQSKYAWENEAAEDFYQIVRRRFL